MSSENQMSQAVEDRDARDWRKRGISSCEKSRSNPGNIAFAVSVER